MDAILAIGRRRRAPRKHVKAALQTGRVESNFENLPGGDADSEGWRQERRSLYPNPRNLGASINRFFDEAEKIDRPGMKAWELAANVQRPAEQYRTRYRDAAPEARRILRGAGVTRGGGGVREQGAPARSAPAARPGDRRALLAQYLLDRGKPDALLSLATGLKGLERQGREQAAPTLTEGLRERRSGGTNLTGSPRSVARSFERIAAGLELPITAREEPGHAEGGDHDPDVKGATAIDVGGDEARRERMFRKITRQLGVRDAQYKGPDINVVKNGLRYQVISRDHGSGPHLHIGIRRVK